MKPINIEAIVDKHDGSRGGLIGMLNDIQASYGYLPQEALTNVSEKTGHSMVDIYGVVTFYKSFSLEPRGKHLCSVCTGTACHVRSAPLIAEEFERQLEVGVGSTTKDQEFTLETVSCVGTCALGPIVVVDGHYFSEVNTAKVKKILRKSREGLDNIKVMSDNRVFPIVVSCSHCNHSLMDDDYLIDDHPSIRVTVSFGRKHGWMRMSCLYGSYNVESKYEIPDKELVNFFCPHCHSELAGAVECSECAAPMAPMIVRGGGILQICSRRGCRGHILDLSGVFT